MDRRAIVSVLAWMVAGTTAAWAVVRVFGLERGYPLVPLLAFTPYVCVAALLATGLFAWRRRWAPAALTGLAAAALVGTTLPRALGEEAAGGIPLRVMTANMKLGQADAEALVALVREEEVDVLAVQELTPELASELSEAGLDDELGHRVLAPAAGSAGGGLYSREPVIEIRDVPGSLAGPQPGVGLRPAGAPNLRIFSFHPPPPTGPGATDEWAHDLRTIPQLTRTGPLTIVPGDFNATLDHQELRGVLDMGYRDAAEITGDGLWPTWPNGRLFPPQVTIDHVLVDERASVSETSIHELPGSDHRAVLAEVLLPRE